MTSNHWQGMTVGVQRGLTSPILVTKALLHWRHSRACGRKDMKVLLCSSTIGTSGWPHWLYALHSQLSKG